MNPDVTALGEALRRARRAGRLSQQALADRLGCSQQYLSDIELGRRTPGQALAAALERALAHELEQRPRAAAR